VLLHELSHSLVARARGLPVAGITLFIFGGVSTIQGEAEEPGDEFWMALVGPLTSFAIAAAAWLLLRLMGSGRTPSAAVLNYLAYANLALGVFNLIPGFPLDGGRVLRALLWGVLHDLRQATRIAAGIGKGIAYLFIAGGVFMGFGTPFFGLRADVLNGIWLAFIGWFLLNAANASDRQARGRGPRRGSVAALMQAPPLVVSSDLLLGDLVSQDGLGQGVGALIVADGRRLVGLVSLSDVHQVPPERWSTTPVRAVMTPASRLATVEPESSVREALARLAERDVNQLPVIHNGVLVGMLSRADVIRFLQFEHTLGRDGTRPESA
jgi:Zn-dependent protease